MIFSLCYAADTYFNLGLFKNIIKYIEKLGKKRILAEDIQDIIEMKLMSIGKYELAKHYITYRYTRELVRRSNTTDQSIKELIDGESEYWNTENSNKDAKTVTVQRESMIKYASYIDTVCIWSQEGCIRDYTAEEYKKYQTELKNVVNSIKTAQSSATFDFSESIILALVPSIINSKELLKQLPEELTAFKIKLQGIVNSIKSNLDVKII